MTKSAGQASKIRVCPRRSLSQHSCSLTQAFVSSHAHSCVLHTQTLWGMHALHHTHSPTPMLYSLANARTGRFVYKKQVGLHVATSTMSLTGTGFVMRVLVCSRTHSLHTFKQTSSNLLTPSHVHTHSHYYTTI